MSDLQALVAAEAARPPPAGVEALVDALLLRHGSAVLGVLFYGSCRRDVTLGEGIVDLYLVVDDLRAVTGPLTALLGRMLPPNVYYTEVATPAGVVRCKYGLVSLAALEWRARRGFHPYFRARLAQPVSVLGARSAQTRRRLEALLAGAIVAFWEQALAVCPPGDLPTAAVWREGLDWTYRAELRTERGRPERLVLDGAAWFDALAAVLPVPAGVTRLAPDRVRIEVPEQRRRRARWAWQARVAVGKVLSLARLLKGLQTFEGGLDYIAWKLSRHSGQDVQIPDHVRRWPWLFIWPLMWRLYRRGVFR